MAEIKQHNKLRSITIQGYKSIAFDHPFHLDLGDTNILLGANGAGKSNVISFFKMVGAMMRDSLQLYIAKNGSNQAILYYGAKVTPQLQASIVATTEKGDIRYSFSLSYAVPNKLIISAEAIEVLDKDGKIISSHELKNDYFESALGISTLPICQQVKTLLSECKVYQFCDSSELSAIRQSSPVDSAHYLTSDGSNLASFLFYLKNNYNSHYKRIVSYTKGIMPQLNDFYLEPERGYISLKWIDKSTNDYVLSTDQFSDGSIRYIALAALLLQPEETIPSVIVIDEPELGLHPYAIDQLSYMIKEASLHSQVIVATQSPILIDNFNIGDIHVIERDEDNLYTIARKMKEDSFKEWLEDYSISELWAKNVIGGRP